jgi:DNA adenine methylase
VTQAPVEPPPRVRSGLVATRPFLKWAGGKRQLLSELLGRVPRRFGTYHEPFVGGGALFFALRPPRARLSDTNARLVRTYRGLREDPDAVIRLLRSFPHEKEFFLAQRERDIDACSDAEVAAWFIYLNQTGYNGLYRVNRANRFNVPFGSYARPRICDEPRLRAAAAALHGAEVGLADFMKAALRAERGDFVYFDPPYAPLSPTSSFTSYTSDKFDDEDQKRLRDVARELKKRGVHVLVSNSATPLVRDLYARGFVVSEVQARRAVNSRSDRRGAVAELLIT